MSYKLQIISYKLQVREPSHKSSILVIPSNTFNDVIPTGATLFAEAHWMENLSGVEGSAVVAIVDVT